MAFGTTGSASLSGQAIVSPGEPIDASKLGCPNASEHTAAPRTMAIAYNIQPTFSVSSNKGLYTESTIKTEADCQGALEDMKSVDYTPPGLDSANFDFS